MLKKRLVISILMFGLLAVVLSVSLVSAAVEVDTSELREAVTVAGIRAHQQALQDIADDNDGNRAASTSGYDASAAYVAELLEAAGYNVSTQPFDFPFFQELSPSELEQTAPGSETYEYLVDFFTMDYSGDGEVTAPVQAVDLNLPSTGGSTSGCEADDFSDFTAGNIALIQRGTCFFIDKVRNAVNAGAVGVIVFNEGNSPDREPLFGGTLGEPVSIPVLTASFAFGVALNDLIDDGLTLRMTTDTISETRSTFNVLAETTSGRADRVVVVGAHLDSVPEGPGINDNGSGTATILEIALQMAALEDFEPRNKVVFAFWGAEEAGLFGSEYYVSQLSASQIKKIAVNLNFDMLGSPNYARFVYDGDGSSTPLAGPNGSKNIEQVFLEYFNEQELETEPTAFDGRSDYGPFIAVGIPAGGLFSGAEGINPDNGIAYDPCYHLACDTVDNVSEEALDELGDAAAHAVLTFADTTSAVNGTDKGKGKGKWADAMEYDGAHLRK